MKIENLKVWLLVSIPTVLSIGGGYYFQLTRTEWPSWVQAVGSVLAIVAAVLIMGEQHREQKQRALDAARDERANLILATIVHGQEVLELHRVMAKTLDNSDLMPAPMLPFMLSRLGTAIEDLKTIPLARMGRDDGILVAVVKSTASNLLSSLKTIEYNEAKQAPRPNSTTLRIGAVGMKNTATVGLNDLVRVLSELHSRYRALTGFSAPSLPDQP